MTLRNQLTDRLLQLCVEIVNANINYNPTNFRVMVANDDGYNTVVNLLRTGSHTTHYGFRKLLEGQRLDLSMEAEILKEPWRTLFTPEQLSIATIRLQLHGYNV